MDTALLTAVRLAKEGCGGGRPDTILQMPTDIVLAALDYSVFCAEYERAVVELNRGEHP